MLLFVIEYTFCSIFLKQIEAALGYRKYFISIFCKAGKGCS
jgi:hypothetical protein